MSATALAPPYVPPRFVPERDEFGEIIYPSSDGLPMAWTTTHYRFLTLLKDGFEAYYADNPEVFVAGDLFWYPVEGHPEIVVAPDVFIAIGRPKGDRKSYRQWAEGGVAPQAVFEVLSEGNTAKEMMRKMEFFSKYGVSEYLIFDPDEPALQIWERREKGDLQPVDDPQGWKSPLLGVTYWVTEDEKLQIVKPDGTLMLSHADEHRSRLKAEREAAEANARAEAAEERARLLAEKLRAAGIDPDALR